jgi:hypothetical protein
MKSLESRTSRYENDRAYCLPTGAIFVSERVVKGVLPSVLDELLSTRAMLKKAMRQYKMLQKPPAAILRQLEARQLALKYVANVICKFRFVIINICLVGQLSKAVFNQMVTHPQHFQVVAPCQL